MRTTPRPLTTARGRAAAAAALALAAAFTGPLASSAGAQGRWGRGDPGGRAGGSYGSGSYGGYGADRARPLYVWNGRVDREAYVVMQGGDVRTRIDGFDNGAGGGARVRSDLPQADGVIEVRIAEGRGRVDVVEQPSRRNGYRAVVRVRDDDAGAGYYRFAATWRPTGGYGDGRDGGYGNGGYGDGRDNGRGDDRGRWGRGRGGRDDDGRDDRDRDRDRDGRSGDGRGGWGYGGGAGGGTPGGAYGGAGALHWRGRVDDVVEIRLQGDRVDTRTVSGDGASGVRVQRSGAALPARDVAVRVADRAGRGRVQVVQQPHAWNGYTAVVRVEDRDRGADWYDVDVSW